VVVVGDGEAVDGGVAEGVVDVHEGLPMGRLVVLRASVTGRATTSSGRMMFSGRAWAMVTR
jgi:hypothetical protein